MKLRVITKQNTFSCVIEQFVEHLSCIRKDPLSTAILLDVDGTLAPIVRHASDAHIPESTRSTLIDASRKYGFMACVSGRQAADAKRIVGIGSISYVGCHGSEIIRASSRHVEHDQELLGWQKQIEKFDAGIWNDTLHKTRIRVEHKGPIVAYHWRGLDHQQNVQQAVRFIAKEAEAKGLTVHRGKAVLEVRPPVLFNKGRGIQQLLRDQRLAHALYIGDDLTDIDAFTGLRQLQEQGKLQKVVCVAVKSSETPRELLAKADFAVEDPGMVRKLLEWLNQPEQAHVLH